MNPFDLLGDDDTEDLSQLIAAQQVAAPKKGAAQPQAQSKQQPAAQSKPAKLPTKPLPPSQAGKPFFLFFCFNKIFAVSSQRIYLCCFIFYSLFVDTELVFGLKLRKKICINLVILVFYKSVRYFSRNVNKCFIIWSLWTS